MTVPSLPRRTIRVLPPAVAQRIAAGEVVQRPAAVLRELIENALDAGARAVEVEWRGGGLELIAVSDDGHGIPAEEVPLAFRRHGTSKVYQLEDLEGIGTLGFRGEALPSIAAVGLVDLATATDDTGPGTRLVLRGDAMLEQTRVAHTRGTTVRVRELFVDLPVQRGFLPSARVETSLAVTFVRRYALARPDVRFTMKVDGRPAFRAAGLGMAGALAAVYGPAAERLRPLTPFVAGRARISAFLGDPGLTRADREGIVVVVNGRWVQPQRWRTELESAYRSLLPRGRHPVAVLTVVLDAAFVDVNLHPSKLEIRVVDEEATLGVLADTLRRALGTTPQASAVLVHSAVAPHQQPMLTARRRVLAEQETPYIAEAPRYRRMRIIGQVQASMILAEDDTAIYLVDQHRADERAIFERLLDTTHAVEAQELFDPVTLELRPEQETAVLAALPDLARLGFRCERFGRRTFLLRTAPAGLTADTAGAVATLLDHGVLQVAHWQETVCAAVACHAAIKRGAPLGEEQMRAALAVLDGCQVQTLCPHGSPIVVRIEARDLAHHFHWS